MASSCRVAVAGSARRGGPFSAARERHWPCRGSMPCCPERPAPRPPPASRRCGWPFSSRPTASSPTPGRRRRSVPITRSSPTLAPLGRRQERSPRLERLLAEEGVRHGGRRRRSRPIGVDLPDRSAPVQDGRLEHSGRRLGRPVRGREDRPPHAACRRWSWASIRERPPGTATRAIVVRTRRASRGRRPRRRWPRKSIPSSSSSGCSARGRLDPQERARRDYLRKSILDLVRDDSARLQKRLGTADRRKMDEYFSGIRELELRIELSARTADRRPPRRAGAGRRAGRF